MVMLTVSGLILLAAITKRASKNKPSFLYGILSGKEYRRRYRIVSAEVDSITPSMDNKMSVTCIAENNIKQIVLPISKDSADLILKEKQNNHELTDTRINLYAIEYKGYTAYSLLPTEFLMIPTQEKPHNYEDMMDIEDAEELNNRVRKQINKAWVILICGIVGFLYMPLLLLIATLAASHILLNNTTISNEPDKTEWVKIKKEDPEHKPAAKIIHLNKDGLPAGYDDWTEQRKFVFSLYEKYNLPYIQDENVLQYENVLPQSEAKPYEESYTENVPFPYLQQRKDADALFELLDEESLAIANALCAQSIEMLTDSDGNPAFAFEKNADKPFLKAFEWQRYVIDNDVFAQAVLEFINSDTNVLQEEATLTDTGVSEKEESVPEIDLSQIEQEVAESEFAAEKENAAIDEKKPDFEIATEVEDIGGGDRGDFEAELYGEKESFDPNESSELSFDDSFDAFELNESEGIEESTGLSDIEKELEQLNALEQSGTSQSEEGAVQPKEEKSESEPRKEENTSANKRKKYPHTKNKKRGYSGEHKKDWKQWN